MSAEQRNLPEQEHSIKAREHELYAKPLPTVSPQKVKSFWVYLRDTPSEPLASTTKVMLWMTGAIVALLFLAAIWRVAHRHGLRSRDPMAAPTLKTADLPILVPCALQTAAAGEIHGAVPCIDRSGAVDVHTGGKVILAASPVVH